MAAKPGKMRETKPVSPLLQELELFQVPVLYLNTLVFQGRSFVGSPTNQWTSWSSSGFTEHHWGKQIVLSLCTLGQIFPSALIQFLPPKKDLAHFHSFVLIHQLRKCLVFTSPLPSELHEETPSECFIKELYRSSYFWNWFCVLRHCKTGKPPTRSK